MGVNLTNGTRDAEILSMVILGTDVYAAGHENNGTKDVAKYWKNGAAISLTNGTFDASISSLKVVGTDIYAGGYESTISGNGTAKYWKNGTAVTLSNLANDAEINFGLLICRMS